MYSRENACERESCENNSQNHEKHKNQTQKTANRHVVHAFHAYKMVWGWGGVGGQQTGTYAPPPPINRPKHTGAGKILHFFGDCEPSRAATCFLISPPGWAPGAATVTKIW